MRAHEIVGKLAGDLAEYGYTADVRKLTENRKLGQMMDRDKFVNEVKHWINQELTWKTTIQKDESGRTIHLPEPATGEASDIFQVAAERGGPSSGLFDMQAYTVANNLLNEWGFKRGKGLWDTKVLPDGTEVLLPIMVIKEIDDAVDRASQLGYAWMGPKTKAYHRTLGISRTNVPIEDFDPKQSRTVQLKIDLGSAIDGFISLNPLTLARIRMGVTTGIGLPNPAYYFGVFMGNIFQTYQTQGLVSAVRKTIGAPVTAMRLMTGRADMVGAVVARMWKEGSWAPDARAIVTKDGRIYTADMIARHARREGLKSSFIQAETTTSLAEDIRREFPGFIDRMMKAPRWWQNNLIETATALDNYWRVSIFVDELEAGKTVGAAAETARRAVFDYGALTDTERQYARTVVLFYSFMRKNMDLFWDTALRHPERITAQMRLLRGMHNLFIEDDDPELVLRDYMKGKLLVGAKESVLNSYVYQKIGWTVPPIPFVDAMNVFLNLYDSVAFNGDERGQDAMAYLITQTTPWVQMPFVKRTHQDMFFGADIGYMTQIPGWLIEADYNLTGGLLVDGFLGAEPRPVEKALYEELPGHMGWYATNEFNWWMWRNMLQLPGAGRSMSTITALDRANTGAVETMLKLLRRIREEGVDAGWLEPITEATPVIPGKPIETALPRPGLYGEDGLEAFSWQEFLGFIGIRPVFIEQDYIVIDRMLGRQRRKIEERSGVLDE